MVDLARIRNGGLKGLFMACQLSMITDSTDLINWKIHICWSCISICSNLFSQWHVELCEKFLPVLTIELVVPFLRSMLAVRSYWIMPSARDCTLLIIWKIMKMAYCGPWITLVCAILIHHQLHMAYMYSYIHLHIIKCTIQWSSVQWRLYHRVLYSFANPGFGSSHNFSNEY